MFNLKKGFFNLARNVSKHSTMSPKVGAVVVKKKPISVGFNKNKPIFYRFSTHAEVNAILNAGGRFWELKDCEIYVYRERNGLPALAKPCEKCMELIRKVGIKKIYYTVDEYPYWKVEKL